MAGTKKENHNASFAMTNEYTRYLQEAGKVTMTTPFGDSQSQKPKYQLLNSFLLQS